MRMRVLVFQKDGRVTFYNKNNIYLNITKYKCMFVYDATHMHDLFINFFFFALFLMLICHIINDENVYHDTM